MASAREGCAPVRWYQCRPSENKEGSILLIKIPTMKKLPKTLRILVLVQFWYWCTDSKYLQDVEQHCALELYFDDTTRPTSAEPMSEVAVQTNKSSKHNLSSAKQTSMEETVSAANIPESLNIDTGHTSR